MTSVPQLRYFNSGEVAIHYAERAAETANADATYLFIHGITDRHETWDEVIDPIRQGARALAVDLRGHGRSGHTPGSYRLPDYAQDMASLIEHLELGPIVVVGHSLGAMTALQLAATRPELVSAIVLEDPPLFARRIMEELQPERHERFGGNAKLSGSGLSVEQIADQIRNVLPDAAEEEIRKSALSFYVTDADALLHVYDQRIDWSPDLERTMNSIECPVLLMQGNFELGAWMLADDGQRAMNQISNCTLNIWDDTGHLLHSDNPIRFVDQVSTFTAGLQPGAEPL